jgi:hypothetical protein
MHGHWWNPGRDRDQDRQPSPPNADEEDTPALPPRDDFVSWRDLGLSCEQLTRKIKSLDRDQCGLVTELDLSENGLEEVPRCVATRFPKLEVLRLSRNRLTCLPDKLIRLTRLQWLYIDENPLLDAFPSSYVALKSLTRCVSHGCPELPSWMARDSQNARETQSVLAAAQTHFAPLEEACRRALYAFLIIARMRNPVMRRCMDRNVCKLIGRLVWRERGSARVWTRCLPPERQPYYLHKNAF